MKRKDFLRKMRNRRHGEVEPREPGHRRSIDWRTLRVDLPGAGEPQREEVLAVGTVTLSPTGLGLTVAQPCWIRGYRIWEAESGEHRAEFQYRPNEDGDAAPPGAEALVEGDSWTPND
jgi:hypothetical protein